MQGVYGLAVVTPPAEEPLTLAEAKAHLRVDGSDQDPLIAALIGVAREHAEAITRRALVTQTLRLTLDCFAGWDIELPRAPLRSVTSIQYVDTDGATQTLSSAIYRVDAAAEPGRITPAFGEVWPATRAVTGAVIITFVAGFGAAAAVPQTIKQAMLLAIGHWYEHAEEVITGTIVASTPMGFDALLWPNRVFGF